MKIALTKSFRTYVVYGYKEFDPTDYPEFNGMSEDEIVNYINENSEEFNLNDSNEDNIMSDLEYNCDIVKDKEYDEEYEIIKVND
jgi:hypothetical protein